MTKAIRLALGMAILICLPLFNSCKSNESGDKETITTGTTATAEDVPIVTEIDTVPRVNDSL